MGLRSLETMNYVEEVSDKTYLKTHSLVNELSGHPLGGGGIYIEVVVGV